MNLTDYEVTPLRTVFEAVRREADALGVNVLESEIVGLIPQAALQNTSANELKIRDFTPDKILENRLVRILGNLHTSDE
jgi:glutamate formiminotransferase